MNTKQKNIYIIVITLIIIMCLFPPWIKTYKFKNIYSEKPAGYSFIFSPPDPTVNSRRGVELDLERLSIQFIAVVALLGLGLLLSNQSTTKVIKRD